jgi:hypothetical protein
MAKMMIYIEQILSYFELFHNYFVLMSENQQNKEEEVGWLRPLLH